MRALRCSGNDVYMSQKSIGTIKLRLALIDGEVSLDIITIFDPNPLPAHIGLLRSVVPYIGNIDKNGQKLG